MSIITLALSLLLSSSTQAAPTCSDHLSEPPLEKSWQVTCGIPGLYTSLELEVLGSIQKPKLRIVTLKSNSQTIQSCYMSLTPGSLSVPFKKMRNSRNQVYINASISSHCGHESLNIALFGHTDFTQGIIAESKATNRSSRNGVLGGAIQCVWKEISE